MIMTKASHMFCEFTMKKGVKGSGLSPESQTNLYFHNYICIYIRTPKVWFVISDPFPPIPLSILCNANQKIIIPYCHSMY